VTAVDFTPSSTYKAMDSLMKLESPPTAIFSFKNYISLDVLQFLRTKYSQQLTQIDVVGFGNLPLLQYLDHKPTASIEENSYNMGIEAARLIFSNIEVQDSAAIQASQHIKVPCKLIIHH